MLLCPLAPVSVRLDDQAGLAGTGKKSEAITVRLYLQMPGGGGDHQAHLELEIEIARKSHALVRMSPLVPCASLPRSSARLARGRMNLSQYSLPDFHGFSLNFRTETSARWETPGDLGKVMENNLKH